MKKLYTIFLSIVSMVGLLNPVSWGSASGSGSAGSYQDGYHYEVSVSVEQKPDEMVVLKSNKAPGKQEPLLSLDQEVLEKLNSPTVEHVYIEPDSENSVESLILILKEIQEKTNLSHRLKNLEIELYYQGSKYLNEKAITEMVNTFPFLETLTLSYAKYDSNPIKIIARLQNLKTLSIRFMDGYDITPETMKPLLKLPHLSELTLGCEVFKPQVLDIIARLPHLEIYRGRVSLDMIHSFANHRIPIISLSSPLNLEDESFTRFEQVLNLLPNLRKINLGWLTVKATDTEVPLINHNLRKLTISSLNLSCATCFANLVSYKNASRFPSLTKLKIYNRDEDEGEINFKDIETYLPQLAYLELDWDEINSAEEKGLALLYLKWPHLKGTTETTEFQEYFQRRMKDPEWLARPDVKEALLERERLASENAAGILVQDGGAHIHNLAPLMLNEVVTQQTMVEQRKLNGTYRKA